MKALSILKWSLILLLLALVTACRQVPVAQPAASESDQTEIVAPPEEVKPIVVERAVTSDSTFFAANPELMAASRYRTAIEQKIDQPATYGIEELRAQVYAAMLATRSDSAYYAANPELMAASRYGTAIEQKFDQPETYGIEELRAQVYAAMLATRSDSAYYAANPELMAADRYRADK